MGEEKVNFKSYLQDLVMIWERKVVFLVFGNRAWVLRLGALAYLANAAFALTGGGLRSIFWIGWVMMAAGFFTLSFGSAWRSSAFFVGLAVTISGGGVLIYGWVH